MTTPPLEVNVDDLRRRARRRLVGAIVLALATAVFVPMLLESDPKPLGEDVAVRIPPVDDGKFVNRLNDKGKSDGAKAAAASKDAKAESMKSEAPRGEPATTDAAKADTKDAGKDGSKDVGKDGSKDGSKDVGKDGSKDVGKDAAAREAAARDTAAALAALNGESPKEAAASPSAKEGASPAPRRTLAEAEQKVLGAPAAKAPAASAPAANANGPAAKPPETAAAAPAKAQAPVAPPAAAPAGTATPAAAPAGGSSDAAPPAYSVQLAAFADDKGANSLANKLKKAGYPAYTEPLTTSRGTLWRVRVGPYPSREAAAAGRDKLKGEGYSGIVAPSK